MPEKNRLKPMMFRLREEDKLRLEAYSERTRITQSAIIYNALIHYLDEHESAQERMERLNPPS